MLPYWLRHFNWRSKTKQSQLRYYSETAFVWAWSIWKIVQCQPT